jgi:hypothetical protein
MLHRFPCCISFSFPRSPTVLGLLFTFWDHRSNDHLRNTLSTQCLAALECLALEASQGVEDRSDHEEHSGHDQASGLGPDADPLYSAHYEVYGGAHVVGAEFTDKRVELGRRGADAEEERYLDEDDNEGTHSVNAVSGYSAHRNGRSG